MHRSTGLCPTDRASRYLGQLCAHVSRKVEVTWDDTSGHADFGGATCALRADDEGLHLLVEAADAADHDRARWIVDDHLTRFGARDELAITWQAVEAAPAPD